MSGLKYCPCSQFKGDFNGSQIQDFKADEKHPDAESKGHKIQALSWKVYDIAWDEPRHKESRKSTNDTDEAFEKGILND